MLPAHPDGEKFVNHLLTAMKHLAEAYHKMLKAIPDVKIFIPALEKLFPRTFPIQRQWHPYQHQD